MISVGKRAHKHLGNLARTDAMSTKQCRSPLVAIVSLSMDRLCRHYKCPRQIDYLCTVYLHELFRRLSPNGKYNLADSMSPFVWIVKCLDDFPVFHQSLAVLFYWNFAYNSKKSESKTVERQKFYYFSILAPTADNNRNVTLSWCVLRWQDTCSNKPWKHHVRFRAQHRNVIRLYFLIVIWMVYNLIDCIMCTTWRNA